MTLTYRETRKYSTTNRPVIGVHKAKRKSDKPQSMYTQPLTDEATGITYRTKSAKQDNDATPDIDPDSVRVTRAC